MSGEPRTTGTLPEHPPAVGRYAPPAEDDANARALAEFWYTVFAVGHPGLLPKLYVYRALPGPPRCKMCAVPFGGVGPLMVDEGWCPSERNPDYCTVCDLFIEQMSPAVTTVTMPVVYADLCDSTQLALERSPQEYDALLGAFRTEVAGALRATEGFVLEVSGDAVVGVYPPGMSGLARGGLSHDAEPRGLRALLSRDALARLIADANPRERVRALVRDLLGGNVRPGRTPEQALSFATGLAVECVRQLVAVAAPRLQHAYGVTFRAGVHVGGTRIAISNQRRGPALPVAFTGALIPLANRLAHGADRGGALVSDDAVSTAGCTLDGCERVTFDADRPDGVADGSPSTSGKVMRGVARSSAAWAIRPPAPASTTEARHPG